MKKQLLSFASLVALAVTHPSLHLTAAPPDGASSTEESDRQFLNKLENTEAAKAAAAPTTPAQPQVLPAPVEPVAPTAGQRRANAAPNRAASDNVRSTTIAEDAPTPRPTRSATRSTTTTAVPRAEATQPRSGANVSPRRDFAAVRSLDGNFQPDPVEALPSTTTTRTYRTRSIDGAPGVTVKSSTATRHSQEEVYEEDGTHIIHPDEIAQYGVAPTVPTKGTRVTTTYVEQVPAVIPSEAANTDRDEDKNQEHRFFHRLFHGGLFSKHPKD